MSGDDDLTLDAAIKSHRPTFYDDPAVDQLMAMVIELHAQLSVLTDRVDTMERVMDAKGAVTRADLEAYEPDDAVAGERAARRHQDISRLFRVIRKEREAVEARKRAKS